MHSGIFNSVPFSSQFLRRALPLHGEPWRFRVYPQTAGGHPPHHWRLRQAEEGWGAELCRALSVSWGEDAFIHGACDAAVLLLLWLPGVGRRLQVHTED